MADYQGAVVEHEAVMEKIAGRVARHERITEEDIREQRRASALLRRAREAALTVLDVKKGASE